MSEQGEAGVPGPRGGAEAGAFDAFDPFEAAPFDPDRFEAGLPDRPPRSNRWLAMIPIVALLLVVGFVQVPYFEVSPGPTRDVVPLIKVEDHATFPPTGHVLLVAVDLQRVSLYQAAFAWISPTRALLPERDIIPPGETDQQQQVQSLSQMDTSKISASVVALSRYTRYPDKHRPGAILACVGVFIGADCVPAGLPAEGKLFAGDLVTAVNGTLIDDADQLGQMIADAGTKPLMFTVKAGGKTRTVAVTPRVVKGVDHPVIGILPVNNFPFPVAMSSGDIGGPSAGLAWTLGLVDLLTPGDLTGGRVIASTGEIALDGTVHPIGAIQEKVAAVERAGAKIFFVPQDNAADARAVANGITIVPVRTYLDAVSYLLSLQPPA